MAVACAPSDLATAWRKPWNKPTPKPNTPNGKANFFVATSAKSFCRKRPKTLIFARVCLQFVSNGGVDILNSNQFGSVEDETLDISLVSRERSSFETVFRPFTVLSQFRKFAWFQRLRTWPRACNRKTCRTHTRSNKFRQRERNFDELNI